MKKLVFAVQVFGLIVLFPLYVIIEFNHGTETPPLNNSPSVIVKEPADNSIRSEVRTENVVFRYW